MFFRLKNAKKLLSFDDTNLMLLSSNEKEITFSFNLSLPINDLFQLNTFKLKIEAYYSNNENILTSYVNLMKYFSDSELSALNNGVNNTTTKIQSTLVDINVADFDLSQSNIELNSLQIRQAFYDSIFLSKIAPSESIFVNKNILNYFLQLDNNKTSFTKKATIFKNTLSNINVSEVITFQNISDVNKTIFLRLSLLDSNDQVIDFNINSIKLVDKLMILNTPTKPPIVKFNNSGLKNLIQLVNYDNNAKYIKVYVKNIQQHKNEVFQNVGFVTLKNNIANFISSYVANTPKIYRFVTIGKNNIESCDFTDIVVAQNRAISKYNSVLTTRLSESGIYVELFNLPIDVVSVQFFKTNKTIFSKREAISSQILLNESTLNQNYISILDTNVKHNHIYEYNVEFVLKNGLKLLNCYVITEFLKHESYVLTNIDSINTNVSNSNVNVTFNFNTSLLDNDYEILQSLLKKNIIDQYYYDELKNDRQKLKKIIAHQVFRTNLYTGEKEDCGIHVSDTYDDVAAQQTYKQKSLNTLHTYRYEIFPLLRSSETLFETYVATGTDTRSKRTYTYSPAKFLHPQTLNYGIILSEIGKKILYAKNDMTYGIVGNASYVDIEFDLKTFKFTACSVSKVNMHQHKITWNYIGNDEFVDHVLLMQETFDTKKIIGKISGTSIKNRYYLHSLKEDDVAQYRYSLIPIFIDYTHGAQQFSNLIEVNNVNS